MKERLNQKETEHSRQIQELQSGHEEALKREISIIAQKTAAEIELLKQRHAEEVQSLMDKQEQELQVGFIIFLLKVHYASLSFSAIELPIKYRTYFHSSQLNSLC